MGEKTQPMPKGIGAQGAAGPESKNGKARMEFAGYNENGFAVFEGASPESSGGQKLAFMANGASGQIKRSGAYAAQGMQRGRLRKF